MAGECTCPRRRQGRSGPGGALLVHGSLQGNVEWEGLRVRQLFLNADFVGLILEDFYKYIIINSLCRIKTTEVPVICQNAQDLENDCIPSGN